MSLQSVEAVSAEERFRQAFERLKAGDPKLLERGLPVTQNNVAREAGCDPTALKKSRYPVLIRQIQAYVELRQVDQPIGRRAAKQRAKRSSDERLKDMRQQRDQAQSILASANRRIIELTEAVQDLQRQVDELRPPPTRLGR